MLQNVPADLDLHVTLLGKELRLVPSAKDLGEHMGAALSFDDQIKSISSSSLSSLCQINRVKPILDTNTLLYVINALVFSKSYYCSYVLSSTTNKNINKLQHVQNFAARIITRPCTFDLITSVLRELKIAACLIHACLPGGILAFQVLKGIGNGLSG